MVKVHPPKSPVAINYVPPGGRPYHVKTGDTLVSIAKANRISEAQLTTFNFKTTNPREINWYLQRLHCHKTTHDGKNYIFTSEAKPVTIYIPVQSVPSISIYHKVTLFRNQLTRPGQQRLQ